MTQHIEETESLAMRVKKLLRSIDEIKRPFASKESSINGEQASDVLSECKKYYGFCYSTRRDDGPAPLLCRRYIPLSQQLRQESS